MKILEKKNKPKKTKNIDKKVTKINTEFKSQNFIYTKKIKTIFIVIILIIAILIGRIGFLQFVQGTYLKEMAYTQQSINQIISPKRGAIYDSTGQTLATSASVDTITINPEKIKDSKNSDNTQALKEKVAKAFSDIFQLDYDETLKDDEFLNKRRIMMAEKIKKFYNKLFCTGNKTYA